MKLKFLLYLSLSSFNECTMVEKIVKIGDNFFGVSIRGYMLYKYFQPKSNMQKCPQLKFKSNNKELISNNVEDSQFNKQNNVEDSQFNKQNNVEDSQFNKHLKDFFEIIPENVCDKQVLLNTFKLHPQLIFDVIEILSNEKMPDTSHIQKNHILLMESCDIVKDNIDTIWDSFWIVLEQLDKIHQYFRTLSEDKQNELSESLNAKLLSIVNYVRQKKSKQQLSEILFDLKNLLSVDLNEVWQSFLKERSDEWILKLKYVLEANNIKFDTIKNIFELNKKEVCNSILDIINVLTIMFKIDNYIKNAQYKDLQNILKENKEIFQKSPEILMDIEEIYNGVEKYLKKNDTTTYIYYNKDNVKAWIQNNWSDFVKNIEEILKSNCMFTSTTKSKRTELTKG